MLDGYHFDWLFDKRAGIYRKIVSFDDTNELPGLYADLVINGAENASELDYSVTAPGAQYCLGNDYRVLRSEFSDLATVPMQQRNNLTG